MTDVMPFLSALVRGKEEHSVQASEVCPSFNRRGTTQKWPGAIKKIDPLNGEIFTLPTNKMLNFS